MSERLERASVAGACEALRFARTHTTEEVAAEMAASDQDWADTKLETPDFLTSYLFGYRSTLRGWAEARFDLVDQH